MLCNTLQFHFIKLSVAAPLLGYFEQVYQKAVSYGYNHNTMFKCTCCQHFPFALPDFRARILSTIHMQKHVYDSFSLNCNSVYGNRWYFGANGTNLRLISKEVILSIPALSLRHSGKYSCFDISRMMYTKTVLLKVLCEYVLLFLLHYYIASILVQAKKRGKLG